MNGTYNTGDKETPDGIVNEVANMQGDIDPASVTLMTPPGFIPPIDYRPVINKENFEVDSSIQLDTEHKRYLVSNPSLNSLLDMSEYEKISAEEQKYYEKILNRKNEDLGKGLTKKEEGEANDTDLLNADLGVTVDGKFYIVPQIGEEVVYISEQDIKLADAIKNPLPGVQIFQHRKYAQEDTIKKLTEGLTRQEIIQNCFEDLNFLARFLSPVVHIEDFPPIIVEMWKLVVSGVLSLEEFMGEARYGLGMPRGIGKTQFIKYLKFWTQAFTTRNFVLLVTSVEDNGAETIKDVMAMMRQPHVVEVFGEVVIHTNNTKQKRFTFCGKECIFLVRAIMTAARGLNIDEGRPGLIILDDAQTEENAKSPVLSKALNAWIVSTLIPAGPNTGTVVLFVGNTYMFEGSILTKLIKNPAWATLTIGIIKEDGTSVWEAVHPIKKILASFKQAIYFGFEDRWLAQFMNMTELHDDNKFKDKVVDANYIHRFGGLQTDPVADKEFNVVMIDPSGYKSTSDDVSIINMTKTKDDVPVISHHITKQMNPERNILEALSMAVRCNSTVILVEGVAYQHTLAFWLQKYIDQLGLHYMKIIPFHPGSISKEIRITSSWSKLYAGEGFVAGSILDEYKRSARSFNPLKKDNKDDLLDIIASAFKLFYEKEQIIIEIARKALLSKMLSAPTSTGRSVRYDRV